MGTKDKRKIIADRARLLKEFGGQKTPKATEEIIKEADKVAGGTLSFAGSDVEVGVREIDWSGGHISHQNWRATLNRFGYLTALASAWKMTHDEKYAEAARTCIESWIDYAKTCGLERPGDENLSVALRLGESVHAGWGGTLPAFLDSSAFDDAFVEKMLASISMQAGYLEHHVSGGWGNWTIAQAGALMFAGIRFPFLANASEFGGIGFEVMRKTAPTEFLADGAHIERTPHYHSWVLSAALDYWRLGKIVPEFRMPIDRERLARAKDYEVQAELSGLNDSSTTLRDPEEIPFLESRKNVLKDLCPAKPVKMPPLEQVFPNAGQVFVRSAWKPGADYLAFDCASWGGDHTHFARLSMSLRSGGKLLVADPGIITYERTDPMCAYSKSTPAHSTLNINGMTQAEEGAQILRTEFTPQTAFLYGQYSGGYYEGKFTWGWNPPRGKGAFGKHRRIVFWVRGEYLLAMDEMLTDEASTINNVWQMAPMENCKVDPATLSWQSGNKDVNLYLRMVSAPDGTEMKCYTGSTEPRAGWVGGNGKDAIPAPQVVFGCKGVKFNAHPVVSTVLLAPFKGDKAPNYQVAEVTGSMEKYYHTVVLTLPDGKQDLISWTRYLEVPVNTLSPNHVLSTDAPFIWLRSDKRGKPLRTFMLDGSYLTFEGKQVFAGKEPKAQLVEIKKGK